MYLNKLDHNKINFVFCCCYFDTVILTVENTHLHNYTITHTHTTLRSTEMDTANKQVEEIYRKDFFQTSCTQTNLDHNKIKTNHNNSNRSSSNRSKKKKTIFFICNFSFPFAIGNIWKMFRFGEVVVCLSSIATNGTTQNRCCWLSFIGITTTFVFNQKKIITATATLPPPKKKGSYIKYSSILSLFFFFIWLCFVWEHQRNKWMSNFFFCFFQFSIFIQSFFFFSIFSFELLHIVVIQLKKFRKKTTTMSEKKNLSAQSVGPSSPSLSLSLSLSPTL